jgi:hypothetical protein
VGGRGWAQYLMKRTKHKCKRKKKERRKNTAKLRQNNLKVRNLKEFEEHGLMYNLWRIHEKKMNQAPGDLWR